MSSPTSETLTTFGERELAYVGFLETLSDYDRTRLLHQSHEGRSLELFLHDEFVDGKFSMIDLQRIIIFIDS